jgi:hypothetical protein
MRQQTEVSVDAHPEYRRGYAAAKSDMTKDVIALLGQLATIEHAQDHKLIESLRRKYAFDPFKTNK